MEDIVRFSVAFLSGVIISLITDFLQKRRNKKVINTTLNYIENYSPMFGRVSEVEAMYLILLIQACNLDLTKKEITWTTWQDFLTKEKGNEKIFSSLPYIFKTHNELIESLRKFKREVF